MPARRVEPELLDTLPAADPAALRSRRDLVRLHRVMGTLSTVSGAIERASNGIDPRTMLPLVASRGVALLGAGPVTRGDAVKSVRAGFRGTEIAHLWPNRKEWLLHEYSAGLFSHCFIAHRKRRK